MIGTAIASAQFREAGEYLERIQRLRSAEQRETAAKLAAELPADWALHVHKRPTRLAVMTRDLRVVGALTFGNRGAVREVYSHRRRAEAFVGVLRRIKGLELEPPAERALAAWAPGRTLASHAFNH